MANKKINQLVSKTAILSTDIFGIGDATTGQLFKKTIAELQAAIGGAVISVNGLVGTVVLDTDDIQELATPTNKYFTDARARGAISLTVTGNSGASTYSSGTGVLNVPTYTLAGLGGISATFLSGTSGISYNSTTGVISYSGTVYTDASIRALFSGSTGISYNSSTGAISYSGTVYTDSSVRALISMTTTGDSGASTYNNTTGVINVPNYTLAGLGGISYTSLSGGTGISYNSSTGAISSTITQYTDALARASISITTTGTSGASTYNSTTGVLNVPQYQSVLTNPVTGTGTSGHVTYWNGSGTIAGSANHFWDNANNRLGIGLTSPSTQLHISGSSDSVFTDGIRLNRQATLGQYFLLNYAAGVANILAVDSALGNPAIVFSTSTNGSTTTERMRINPSGFVGIGVTPRCNLEVQKVSGNTSLGVASHLTLLLSQGGSSNELSQIGFGYTQTTSPAVIGFITTDTATNTNGALIFATRSVTSDTAPIERMRLNSAGRLGIGASTTGELRSQLTVMGAGQATAALADSGVTTGTIEINSNAAVGGCGGALTIGALLDNGSYLPFAALKGLFTNGVGNGTGDLAFSTRASTSATSLTERMRITSDGNILMGTSSNNGERLYVSGAIRATSTITANSDIRIKSNITKIENALEKVGQISGYTYNTTYDDKRHGGVIAQEIDKVFPEIVNTGNDGLLGVEYGNISALLIEAIKEQKKEIDELRTIIASK